MKPDYQWLFLAFMNGVASAAWAIDGHWGAACGWGVASLNAAILSFRGGIEVGR